MALGAVEELGGVGGMLESTLMDGMVETYCKGSRQHFYKRVGRSEIEKHVEAHNSDYGMMGGLEDRRPATARSKGKLPRLLCGWTGGGDHPGARGGGEQGGGGAPPIVLRSTYCKNLQSCVLTICLMD